MKIGLIGFGKTGKAVAFVIIENNNLSLEWVLRRSTALNRRSSSEFLGIQSNDSAIIYSSETLQIKELLDKYPVDIIIDFSSETGIYTYGEVAAHRKIIIISAISHYEEREIKLLNKLSKETTVFWSPNITIGVNYLLIVAKFLKKISPSVDIEIIEEHFKEKVGVSGTAVKIAEGLGIKKEKINSIRAGGIVGKHELIFGFPYQTIRLKHESISREAFGNGVVFVAENLINKKEGLFNFEDLLSPYFKP